MIIYNAKIYPMKADDIDSIIENGYVIVENGKITEAGAQDERDFSKYYDAVDAGGAWLMPGFIDGHTHIGMIEDSLTFEGDDVNEISDPVLPQLRAVDAINPMDRCFDEACEGGVTCVAAGPGSANAIGGQFAAIKTHGKRVDDMIVKAPVSMKFALGENPKGCYHGKNLAPETRMATAALMREQLFKAKKYADELDRAHGINVGNDPHFDPDDLPDEPEYDIKNEAMLPVIRGELAVHFHAHRADDIFTAVRIAKEFNLKYAIVHCTDGHLIADELAEDGVMAFVGPTLTDRSKPELKNKEFTTPGILDRKGMLIGITTDHPVIPLQYLPLCAALAVKSGLKPMHALAAITINPARILGIDDRVGSIEAGKDADLVLCTGSPFDVMSDIKGVWVSGERVK